MDENDTQFTIGDKLARARESIGKSREEVSNETRIPLKYIQALEENQFDVFPQPFYVRSYISKLCSSYGLDPKPLHDVYNKISGSEPNINAVHGNRFPIESQGAVNSSKQYVNKPSFFSRKSLQLSKLATGIAVMVGVILILGVLSGVLKLFGGKDSSSSSTAQTTPTEVAQPGSQTGTTSEVRPGGYAVERFIYTPPIRQASVSERPY